MSDSARTYGSDDTYLRSVSAFERIERQLDIMDGYLRTSEAWLPGREVRAEIAWSRKKIGELQASWGRKLVVALVGPSGAGKSTLLNALAGRELSVTGRQRPTTREVIVYAQSLADAEELLRHCGADSVRTMVDYDAEGLEYLTLVDAPDTNTMPENQALLVKVLEKTDVVVAVFPATNPKMHDNIVFLRPYVQSFPRGAVVAVLNQVDRVPRAELEGEIVPDFRGTIATEWDLSAQRVFLTSARSSVPGANYPEDERPLHQINETSELKRFLLEYVKSEGQVVDRRLARAEQLVALVRKHAAEALERSDQARTEARVRLAEFTQQTARVLIAEFQRLGEKEGRSGPGTALYAELSPRWWGPVGWLVGIWNILLSLGSAVGRFFRRGSPARQISARPIDSDQRGRARQSDGVAQDERGAAALSFVLRDLYTSEWPPVADALVKAGFDVVVRDTARWAEWAAEYEDGATSRWQEAFQGRIHNCLFFLDPRLREDDQEEMGMTREEMGMTRRGRFTVPGQPPSRG